MIVDAIKLTFESLPAEGWHRNAEDGNIDIMELCMERQMAKLFDNERGFARKHDEIHLNTLFRLLYLQATRDLN